jgi:hypothetical protein
LVRLQNILFYISILLDVGVLSWVYLYLWD